MYKQAGPCYVTTSCEANQVRREPLTSAVLKSNYLHIHRFWMLRFREGVDVTRLKVISRYIHTINYNQIGKGQPAKKQSPPTHFYPERGGNQPSESWELRTAGIIDHQHALLASAEVFITTSPPTSSPAAPCKFNAANWTWLRLCSGIINFFLWREWGIDFPGAPPPKAGVSPPLSCFFFSFSVPSFLSHVDSLQIKQVIYNRPPLRSHREQDAPLTSFTRSSTLVTSLMTVSDLSPIICRYWMNCWKQNTIKCLYVSCLQLLPSASSHSFTSSFSLTFFLFSHFRSLFFSSPLPFFSKSISRRKHFLPEHLSERGRDLRDCAFGVSRSLTSHASSTHTHTHIHELAKYVQCQEVTERFR